MRRKRQFRFNKRYVDFFFCFLFQIFKGIIFKATFFFNFSTHKVREMANVNEQVFTITGLFFSPAFFVKTRSEVKRNKRLKVGAGNEKGERRKSFLLTGGAHLAFFFFFLIAT